MLLRVKKVREEAILPQRANPSDAGADVFYCPENAIVMRIKPGQSRLFQTGLKFEVPHGYMLEVKNRSSVAAKGSLIVGACVIDSGYNGEVFVNLHNIGEGERVIYPGEKIAQVVLIPVTPFRVLETEGELYSDAVTISNRGDGALGSTGG
jgi:dUTP pyrophosphatase